MSTYGILVGGGPAPGINGVIGAAAMAATRAGDRLIGILEGVRTDKVLTAILDSVEVPR